MDSTERVAKMLDDLADGDSVQLGEFGDNGPTSTDADEDAVVLQARRVERLGDRRAFGGTDEPAVGRPELPRGHLPRRAGAGELADSLRATPASAA